MPQVTRFQIKSALVSTVDPSWAAIEIEGWQRHRDIGPATVVLRWGQQGLGHGKHNNNNHNNNGHGGGRQWRVVTFGTFGSGCGVPDAVQTDLHLSCS
jgi:hypothetical protein